MFFCTQYFSQNQLRNKKKKQGEKNVRAMMMHPEVEDAIFDKMLYSSVCLSMLPSSTEAAVLVR
jgi:hypothetical protein